ncbi:MAG: hypothetical protein QM680_13615 [Luteolibacter sp.]
MSIQINSDPHADAASGLIELAKRHQRAELIYLLASYRHLHQSGDAQAVLDALQSAEGEAKAAECLAVYSGVYESISRIDALLGTSLAAQAPPPSTDIYQPQEDGRVLYVPAPTE